MTGPSYPLGIALKGAGGRKTKDNRHIRSSRSKYRAFRAEVRKLVGHYQRKTGFKVSAAMTDEELDERSALDPDFAIMRDKVFAIRAKYLGY
ncbi:hypothetical protein [Sagittula sp. MA-2]|jgi:hypothetical protein|uniref:hypothetical protein n=1 Tax=Sagittula sp. MA-2 TaxID=3048007 RepID=UPI0024C31C08|nr:hypothetical protein [Sagittula sp. MA-2]WHZ35476.1 hypothetical protein QNI11_00375 [Sagittula sp. MA-2]